MVYANTSAAVKARADWMVTSSIAEKIVAHLHAQGKKILFAPDKHLGDYIRNVTGADMLLWNASCVVHEEFKAQQLEEMKLAHPGAKVLVHPESPASVIAMADAVGSTTGIIQAAERLGAKEYIVATDGGIIHQMKKRLPGVNFIEAPTAGQGRDLPELRALPVDGDERAAQPARGPRDGRERDSRRSRRSASAPGSASSACSTLPNCTCRP